MEPNMLVQNHSEIPSDVGFPGGEGVSGWVLWVDSWARSYNLTCVGQNFLNSACHVHSSSFNRENRVCNDCVQLLALAAASVLASKCHKNLDKTTTSIYLVTAGYLKVGIWYTIIITNVPTQKRYKSSFWHCIRVLMSLSIFLLISFINKRAARSSLRWSGSLDLPGAHGSCCQTWLRFQRVWWFVSGANHEHEYILEAGHIDFVPTCPLQEQHFCSSLNPTYHTGGHSESMARCSLYVRRSPQVYTCGMGVVFSQLLACLKSCHVS